MAKKTTKRHKNPVLFLGINVDQRTKNQKRKSEGERQKKTVGKKKRMQLKRA